MAVNFVVTSSGDFRDIKNHFVTVMAAAAVEEEEDIYDSIMQNAYASISRERKRLILSFRILGVHSTRTNGHAHVPWRYNERY